jgi:hypothetical protein
MKQVGGCGGGAILPGGNAYGHVSIPVLLAESDEHRRCMPDHHPQRNVRWIQLT